MSGGALVFDNRYHDRPLRQGPEAATAGAVIVTDALSPDQRAALKRAISLAGGSALVDEKVYGASGN